MKICTVFCCLAAVLAVTPKAYSAISLSNVVTSAEQSDGTITLTDPSTLAYDDVSAGGSTTTIPNGVASLAFGPAIATTFSGANQLLSVTSLDVTATMTGASGHSSRVSSSFVVNNNTGCDLSYTWTATRGRTFDEADTAQDFSIGSAGQSLAGNLGSDEELQLPPAAVGLQSLNDGTSTTITLDADVVDSGSGAGYHFTITYQLDFQTPEIPCFVAVPEPSPALYVSLLLVGLGFVRRVRHVGC